MRKILITICTFLLVSLSALCAIGSNFKNSLLSVDVKKTGESSYNIILNTQSPYAEPIKVIQKSDYDYYILLPETYSLIPESSSNSDIKNFSVQLFPYAGQSSQNGYTKITILTVRPISFSASVNSIDKNTPTKTDLDKIAQLNSLDNNTVNAIKKAEPKTISPKETVKAPQKQTVQNTAKTTVQAPQKQQVAQTTAKTTPATQKVAAAPQKAVQNIAPQAPQKQVAQAPNKTTPATQKVAAAPQNQVVQNTVKVSKVSNPINVSNARKENIISYVPQNKAAEVKIQTPQVQNTVQTKPAVRNVAQTKPKAENIVVKKDNLPQVSTTKQETKQYAKPAQEQKEEPAVQEPKVNDIAQKETVEKSKQEKVAKNTKEPKLEDLVIPTESDYEDEGIIGEEEKQTIAKNEIISKIKEKISNIDFKDKKTIGIIAFIVILFLMIVFRKRKKQPQYQNVPQSAYTQSTPDIVEVQDEVASNTYVEEDKNIEETEETPIEEESYIEEGIVEDEIQPDTEEDIEEVSFQEEMPEQEEIVEEPVMEETEEPVMEETEEPVMKEEDEEVSLDELDEVYLDEVDDMEAQIERRDEEEFAADNEIDIIEDTKQEEIAEEPIVEETAEIPQEKQNYSIEEPVKTEPASNVKKETYIEPESEGGAEVLSSVQIDANKGFCVTYYNNQLILIGYVGEDIFLIHKFKRGEITNAQIKFRLSDSNLNEDFYMVKVDNSKFLVKVTPSKMSLELLV